jgi:GNAT superfamily N-acetyltransferase
MATDDAWIDLLSTETTLEDGTRVLIRPIRAADKGLLEEGVRRLSPTSRYLRFMHYFERLTPSELRYLTEVDYHDRFAWIAIGVGEVGQPGLGVARYIRDTNQPHQAEAAVAVIDDYQNKGLGTLLLSKLANTARENGIKAFVAYVTPENPLITHLLDTISATAEDDHGLLRMVVPIGEDAPGPANLAILRAAARGDVELRSPPGPKGKAGRRDSRSICDQLDIGFRPDCRVCEDDNQSTQLH